MKQATQDFPRLPQDMLAQINQNRARYEEMSQIAMYSSLEGIDQLAVFTKSTCDVQCNVVFCYHAQNFVADKEQDISYFIIRTLNQQIPKLKNKYSLAYVHDSLSSFLYFRKLIRMLPAQHFRRLKTFYIVHAGLGVRFLELLSFGEINAFIKERTVHINNVDEIESANKITLGGNIVSKSKLKLQMQRQQTENYRNTHVTKQMEPSDNTIIRNGLYGKEISDYERTQASVPAVIQGLVVRLYSNTSFLQSEGIMRKSCDVEQLEILENCIMNDQNWLQFVRKYDNPYVLSGCLKKIFNNLNTPLFSYQIYDMIMMYRSDGQLQNDIDFLARCIGKMSKISRLVLLYTTAFLVRGVVANQQFNKMSAYNLAVVFGPCFFRPKNYRLEDLMASGKFSFMIKLLLENYDAAVGESEAVQMYNLLDAQKQVFKGY